MVAMPVVWSDAHVGHVPGGEVWVGLQVPGDEVPERAERIRQAVVAAGATFVEAASHTDDVLLAVHDAGLVGFLRTAWQEWEKEGYPAVHGQPKVVPYIFPHPGLVGNGRLEPAEPRSLAARTGRYAFDTMTPIGPGTWDAARGAVDAALTAGDLVAGGAPAAYALTRPPGHHVTRSAYGGSCFLNNTAIAAESLRRHAFERVAVVDIDAHHGNGAQSIFWQRDDVVTISVHVDPAAGWFPHFLGFAGETGAGRGVGANHNITVAPETRDEGWVAAVGEAAGAAQAARADVLVIALGVDAGYADENSPLRVTDAGFRDAGRLLGSLGLPTVIVQEGGYDLATIGELVVASLTGLEEGMANAV